MRLEERDSREIPVRLGAATKAVQRVLQAAVDLGAAKNCTELHLRATAGSFTGSLVGGEGEGRCGRAAPSGPIVCEHWARRVDTVEARGVLKRGLVKGTLPGTPQHASWESGR